MDDDCVGPTHHDFGGVFVHGPLTVADMGDVLDDYTVIWGLAFVVQYPVRFYHVVYNIAFGNLEMNYIKLLLSLKFKR